MALVCLMYFSTARYNVNVCVVHIDGSNNVIASCLSCFQQKRFKQLAPLANPTLDNTPAQPIQSFIEASSSASISSTYQTYRSGLNAFNKFCLAFGILPFPASFLTLEYFCMHVSQHVYYKTLKVYLSGIRLTHIEQGMADPIESASLHLVYRGICHQQGDYQKTNYPSQSIFYETQKSNSEPQSVILSGTMHAVGCVYCGILWIFTCKQTNTHFVTAKLSNYFPLLCPHALSRQ